MGYLDNTDLVVEEDGTYVILRDGVSVPDSEFQYVSVSILEGKEKNYLFAVHLNNPENACYFVVDRNLNLINYNQTEDVDTVRSELDAHRDTVQKLVDDAIAAWPFVG
ncbi:MAG: hypothetical protein IIY70_04615 [Oscillospiraceae bacterium]|nr:hypothetical protein [Oscillospiraceae bacterium]